MSLRFWLFTTRQLQYTMSIYKMNRFLLQRIQLEFFRLLVIVSCQDRIHVIFAPVLFHSFLLQIPLQPEPNF